MAKSMAHKKVKRQRDQAKPGPRFPPKLVIPPDAKVANFSGWPQVDK